MENLKNVSEITPMGSCRNRSLLVGNSKMRIAQAEQLRHRAGRALDFTCDLSSGSDLRVADEIMGVCGASV